MKSIHISNSREGERERVKKERDREKETEKEKYVVSEISVLGLQGISRSVRQLKTIILLNKCKI